MIELRAIDRHNFSSIINLNVAESQRTFVASNAYSLAEAKAKPECIPLAAYADGAPVGFVMYCIDDDDKEYWIYRLMIDEKHQGKGYGRLIMNNVLSEIKADKNHDKVYISFEPENETAKRLYESLGFRPDGRVIDGEVVYVMNYGQQEVSSR